MGMTPLMLFLDILNDKYNILLDEYNILDGCCVGQLYQNILDLSQEANPTEVWDYLTDWFSNVNQVDQASIKPEMALDWDGRLT